MVSRAVYKKEDIKIYLHPLLSIYIFTYFISYR